MGTEAVADAGGARGGRLAQLYERYAAGALRVAYLMTGDRDLAEDLVQDAFVKVAGRFADLRSPDAFGAYLKRTVVNLSRGHFRHLKVERNYLEREGGRRQPAPEPPDIEGREALWASLSELPHRQRAVLVLRYYEDLSEHQTAEILGCSVSAVKSLTNRAMTMLRTKMRGESV